MNLQVGNRPEGRFQSVDKVYFHAGTAAARQHEEAGRGDLLDALIVARAQVVQTALPLALAAQRDLYAVEHDALDMVPSQPEMMQLSTITFSKSPVPLVPILSAAEIEVSVQPESSAW